MGIGNYFLIAKAQRTRRKAEKLSASSAPLRPRLFIVLVALAFATASCIIPSTKQVVKIGLLAPFDGLYRNTGYNELAAMRSAIAEHQSGAANPEIVILPLALDLSVDTERAAEKIVADPSVKVVVAPVAALYTPEIAAVIAASGAKLIFPQRTTVAEDPVKEMVLQLLAEIADAARREGAKRLVLTGAISDWPNGVTADWDKILVLPTIVDNDVAIVQQTDAVIWWGPPAEGAAYLDELRAAGMNVPFWMGPEGGNPVFVAHAEAFDNVYWATWA